MAGDKILVTNGKAAPDTCEVTVTDDGVAEISTELTGPLTAIYPATAAKMNAGNPNQIDASFVSSEQTGKFADANICMASVEEFGTSTYFKNEYALFVITPPEGADSLTIRSLCQIQQETGQRTGGKTSICMSDVKKESYIVTISGEPVEDGQYYVALSGGVNLSDLSFEVSFGEDSIGSIKGIPACKIAEQAGADIGSESYNVYNTVKNGTIYKVSADNWHPYVTISGRKWATMNVGATESNIYGTYFTWGDVVGQNPDLTVEPDPISKWRMDAFPSPFPEAPAIGNPEVLPLDRDAANANWGGAWRMPTGADDGEFIALKERRKSDGLEEKNGVKGLFFINENNTEISMFIPIAGCGEGPHLKEETVNGYYWSSNGDSNNNASVLWFKQYNFNMYSRSRNYAYPVRAIIDESVVPDEEEEEEEEEKEEVPATEVPEVIVL